MCFLNIPSTGLAESESELPIFDTTGYVFYYVLAVFDV